MFDSDIKLNQIVSEQQIKERYWSELHKVNSSLKRNIATDSKSLVKKHRHYECQLPDVGFDRKDLSLILRYLLQKQEMTTSDRNLLRRILLSNFDQYIISAGSRKMLESLRIEQNQNEVTVPGRQALFFLLKGNGMVKSGKSQYLVKRGDIFGELQMLSETKMKSIQFNGGFLMLVLQKKQFDLLLRDYFVKKYEQRKKDMESTYELYLSQIPKMFQYILYKNLQYKYFTTGDRIVSHKEPVKNIYFLISNDKGLIKSASKGFVGCLGLFEVINDASKYAETIFCDKMKVRIPYIDAEIFRQYALKVIVPENIQRNQLNKSMINLNKSYLSIGGLDFQEPKPQLKSFMRKKKIKLALNRSRIKTQANSYCEADFRFLKFDDTQNSLRYSKYSNRNKSSIQRVKTSLSKMKQR